jgi:hypothetical protein
MNIFSKNKMKTSTVKFNKNLEHHSKSDASTDYEKGVKFS